MGILGLTDRGAQFPRIGILRKGSARPEDGKHPGKDLTYFRFDSDDRAATEAFQRAYGDEPNYIHVYLPFQTTGENFQAWREEWGAGSLKHRCDGQEMTLWQDGQGKYHREPKPCANERCKPVGRLTVIVPDLQRFAYVTVQTTSIHDIMTLQSNLEAVEMLRGDLRGIPFVLSRRPREISTPRGDKRVRAEKWLLSIEASSTWVPLQLAAMERAALPAGTVKLLSDGRELNVVTGEIIDQPTFETEEAPPAEPVKTVAAPFDRAICISKIRKDWAKERDLTDDLALQNEETSLDLTRLDDEALIRLNRTVYQRVAALREIQADEAAVTTT